jgi:transcriptional regulator with XRE-family HTH domain
MIQQDSIKIRMFECDITLTQLCELAGVSDGTVSRWLRCTKSLSNESYKAIDETLTDVAALIELVKPVPLDRRNTYVIRELISKMHRGELNYLIKAKELAAKELI